jgi:Amt family ammonium transporter
MQQLGVQAAAVGIAIAYAALGTLIIIFLVNKVIGFRASTEAEMQGLDYNYHGEQGYGMLNPR